MGSFAFGIKNWILPKNCNLVQIMGFSRSIGRKTSRSMCIDLKNCRLLSTGAHLSVEWSNQVIAR
jgi:hypothetical protein